MGPRVLLLAALLALPLAAPPGGAASVSCDYDQATDYVAANLQVHYVRHRCRYYDVWIDAWVVDRLDRYDGTRTDPLGPGQHVFTYYTQSVETTYVATGRVTFEHETFLGAAGATLTHDYNEERAGGVQKCHGAAEAHTSQGRVSVPRTPDYPKCVPPGMLA